VCFMTVKVCLLKEAFRNPSRSLPAVLCRRRSPGLRFSHNFSQLWRSTNTDPGIATMHESRSRRRAEEHVVSGPDFLFLIQARGQPRLPLFTGHSTQLLAQAAHPTHYNIDSYCRIINKGGQIELINNTLCGRTSYELLLKPSVEFCIEG